MAGASDKARFYLEQSVPELKECEKKNIFTAQEINSIARKRSEFEHKINARGPSPFDFARYAEFEINVDTLRRKRVKRLGVKAPTYHGQRRIFFVFDRGTHKHPGDVGLWMQTLEFAKKQNAHKKLIQILTKVLRLHPTNPDLWIYGAQFAVAEHADMTAARSYMQRGLRFCRVSKRMWLEFFRLEMLYIAKIAARRRVLGIDADRKRKAVDKIDDMDADVVLLPHATTEDINGALGETDMDETVLRALDDTPAMRGAIPVAIYDAAMNHFNNDPAIGLSFFDICSEFDHNSVFGKVLQHIGDTMMGSAAESWEACVCHVKVPVAGLHIASPEFPPALGISLRRLKRLMPKWKLHDRLTKDLSAWLQALLQQEGLDPALETVLTATLQSLT